MAVEKPTLQRRYEDTIRPVLQKEFGLQSVMAVPRLEKIVINVGLGDAVQNPKLIDGAVEQIGKITGQRPVVTRSKKAISNFKLREKMPIGVAVTLRRERMWEFLERFIRVALPRVRDFRGLPNKGFDGRGNLSIGLREQIIFPEIDLDKIMKIMGLQITFVTTADSDDEALALLKHFGLPFKSNKN
jgi:large subunit ribosomal protein L5